MTSTEQGGLDDPVLVEILRNRFVAITEEMASFTLRTALTVFGTTPEPGQSAALAADHLATVRFAPMAASMVKPTATHGPRAFDGRCRDETERGSH